MLILFAGSLLPAILFGAAFANILRGIPIDGDGIYHGTLLTLLNPYGLLGGDLFLLFFLIHGAIWLAIKSEGGLHNNNSPGPNGDQGVSCTWQLLKGLVLFGCYYSRGDILWCNRTFPGHVFFKHTA